MIGGVNAEHVSIRKIQRHLLLQILLMSDMAEFDDLRLELQKLKKKKQSTEVLGKVRQCVMQMLEQ